jgi:hypothetical protein
MWIMVIAVLVGTIVLAGLAYELGQIRAGHNRLVAQQRYGQLEDEYSEATGEVRQLREKIARLETGDKVKAEAYRQVEDQLIGLQTRILEQQEDLAFYRGIVSADQQAGLRVQDFELSAGSDTASYVLHLVLAQAIRNDKRVSGHVELSVEGSRSGEPVTMSLADLVSGGDGENRIEYSFRYFQNLQTDLVLPEGFAPVRVVVRLKPKGKGAKVVEKEFDWPVQPGQGA